MKSKIRSVFIFATCLLLCKMGFAQAPTTMPEFSLQDIKGNTVASQSLSGKNIVINFWAAWCDSCEEEAPKLNALQKLDTTGNTVFLAINAGDSTRAIQRFLDKTGFAFTILLDPDKATAKKFNVLGLPQTFVINSQGQIVYHDTVPPKDLKMLGL